MILQERKKESSWATPFEVHLAARRFNCIIHLFHFDDSGNEYYCFKPDPVKLDRHRRLPGSRAQPNIFLKYKILPANQEFHFEWFQVSPKVFRAGDLFSALQMWMRQSDVRPITYYQLGRNEHEFKLKCSNIFEAAQKESRFQYDVMKPMVVTQILTLTVPFML
jgi:hypothetical protein